MNIPTHLCPSCRRELMPNDAAIVCQGCGDIGCRRCLTPFRQCTEADFGLTAVYFTHPVVHPSQFHSMDEPTETAEVPIPPQYTMPASYEPECDDCRDLGLVTLREANGFIIRCCPCGRKPNLPELERLWNYGHLH